MDSKVNTTRAMPMPAAGWLNGVAVAIKKHLKVFGVIALLLVGGVLGFFWWNGKSSAEDYVTDKISRGSVEVNVSATGTVQAVTTVQVGSQVSGTVQWLGADFKSHVSRGQVVAKLDPALFQAQVDTAQANLLNAQAGVQGAMTDINNQIANVEAAKANDRANAAARDDAQQIAQQNEKLKDVIPDRDIQASENAAKVAVARYSQATSQIAQAQAQLEISKSKLKQAQAAVKQAQAQLEQANVNMQHSIITSPIDGVVVSRTVDVGQTVAASLSAPTLFTIANDLTSMQVLASIDEADVGQVREGGKATFTVDAYPGQSFGGDITQVRLNAQTLQNVVTYTAVINVSNPDLKLMPGMTANITIPVARRDNVLRVPNAALRFKPDLTDQQQKDLQAKMDAWRQQQRPNAGESDQQPSESPSQTATPAASEKPGQTDGNSSSAPRQRGQGRKPSEGQQGNSQSAKSESANSDSTANSAVDNSSSKPRRRNQQAGDNANTSASQPGEKKQGGQNQSASSEGGNSNRKRGGQNEQATTQTQQPTPSPADNQTPGSNRSGGVRRPVQVIWVLTASKTLEPHFVRAGLTDGRVTEIIGSDLKEGDLVVIGQNSGGSNNNNRQQNTTPFSQRPPGAGGGRGR
jgi:HlyD family secretion protein